MKAFKDLGHVHRGQPCLEYPGEWIVYYPNRELKAENKFASFEEAFAFASTKEGFFPDNMFLSDIKVSIYWACSENDPRVGEVWFTGFYRHGEFDRFGEYQG